ncbi:MAG: DUF3108 domain-containing protein [Wenzhouxiangella sp.]|jgi:hypothetical protein|nr:DUF3108 domain-containing protein [Wenzhouxiangella sp.]
MSSIALCSWTSISIGAAAEQGGGQSTDFALPAHTATYDVFRRGSKIGEVDVSLSRDEEGIWFFDTKTTATARLARLLGARAEESAHFVWNAEREHLQMLTYRHVAKIAVRNRFWQHELDWSENVSNTQTYEGDHRIELEPDLLDPLTMRLQLAVDMIEPEARRVDHEFRVLERDEIEDQFFYYLGDERIEVPIGCFDAVRMHRFRKEGSSRNYHSWHAGEFYWMPVRIQQFEDGEEALDIQLARTDLALTASCSGG